MEKYHVRPYIYTLLYSPLRPYFSIYTTTPHPNSAVAQWREKGRETPSCAIEHCHK